MAFWGHLPHLPFALCFVYCKLSLNSIATPWNCLERLCLLIKSQVQVSILLQTWNSIVSCNCNTQNHAIWICLVNSCNWIGAFSLAYVCLKLLNALDYSCLCESFATCFTKFGANLNELCHCKLTTWRRWWILACNAHALLNYAYALFILSCWW